MGTIRLKYDDLDLGLRKLGLGTQEKVDFASLQDLKRKFEEFKCQFGQSGAARSKTFVLGGTKEGSSTLQVHLSEYGAFAIHYIRVSSCNMALGRR